MNIHIFFKKYQHKFHWISVTNSEPSNAYSTKSGSNYPDQQHVPRVDFCLKITYKITIYNIDIHQTSQQLCGYNMRRHWFKSRRWFQIFSPSFIPNWFPLHYSLKHDMRLGFLHGLLHGLLHHSRAFSLARTVHERFTMLKKTLLRAWFVFIYSADILWYKNIKNVGR